ncbi:MAG TPA: 1-(5-phosphoribosyl)-5-amino-4-imidazole-carboxylate carboxylase, partial [Lachnospiraceae bacterium]|nr:1-(5-phosphoribosyl)-5-amino-4-imidazole-carboxylate carboxylase [Lachnospiraceae bacterium]
MNTDIRSLLEEVSIGSVSVDEAVLKLKMQPFEDIDFAKVDLHRKLRQGNAEVIYGAGKSADQIRSIAETLVKNGQTPVLITRIDKDKAESLKAGMDIDYHEDARIAIVGEIPVPAGRGKIVVATGGTSDVPVAEEAALTAEVFGNEVVRLYDVGVAGIHRLMAHKEEIMSANVIIAIAGMEGA